VLLGAHCGEAAPESLDALGRFANRIGLLFQVVDDILDAEASTATLGKTAGKDAAQNKPTYVNILGAGEAKAMAATLRQDAHEALAPFGDTALRLHELTDFIVERTF
jgi:farnesyl diphosphate synthase